MVVGLEAAVAAHVPVGEAWAVDSTGRMRGARNTKSCAAEVRRARDLAKGSYGCGEKGKRADAWASEQEQNPACSGCGERTF